MTRRNPGDERLRDLERRARQGDPEAQRALTAAQARRGDARAEADILAEALRQHPTLDHQRAVMAAHLGEFLDQHGVQALVATRSAKSDPVKVPGRKATAPRAKLTVTYGFDTRPSWIIDPQGLRFGTRVFAGPRGDVPVDLVRRFMPSAWPVVRWNNMTDGGADMVQWVDNASFWHVQASTGRRVVPYHNESPTLSESERATAQQTVDSMLIHGALPGDFFDWPFSQPMPRERFQAMLEASRGPALYRAFLADLYVFDLARFPADLAAMPEQRPFIEARAERAQQAERRFTGLR